MLESQNCEMGDPPLNQSWVFPPMNLHCAITTPILGKCILPNSVPSNEGIAHPRAKYSVILLRSLWGDLEKQ